MKKIFIIGRRFYRTPFGYPEYKKLFQKRFEYVQKPEDADYLVLSCKMDLRENLDEIGRILKLLPDIQVVILSEEPLWDTLMSDNFLMKRQAFSVGGQDQSFVFLNHFTSKIYDFEKIPYFITTEDDYFARYSYLFNRNRTLKKHEIKSIWTNAKINMAFYAEFRDQAHWTVHVPGHDIKGLCRYRTLVANEIKGDKIERVGKGWPNHKKIRQSLPDWHLSKLVALDQNCSIVSGIENTHCLNYVTEKLFDAFAVLGVPLYYGGPEHSAMRVVPMDSFLNLYGLSVEKAVEKIYSFIPNKIFMDQYHEAQLRLADTFSSPMVLVRERERIVNEIIFEFNGI